MFCAFGKVKLFPGRGCEPRMKLTQGRSGSELFHRFNHFHACFVHSGKLNCYQGGVARPPPQFGKNRNHVRLLHRLNCLLRDFCMREI